MQTISDTLKVNASMMAQAVVGALPSGILAPNGPDCLLSWEDVEKPVPDEDVKIERVGELICRAQENTFKVHGKGYRGTHLKTQALVTGTLIVSPSLPAYLQQGVFSTPGKRYDLVARFANEPSHILPDTAGQPRGMAMKVFRVEGERLSGEGNTHDFHFNNAPMIELTDLDTTLEIFELRVKYWDDPEGLQEELKKRSDMLRQLAPAKLPHTHILTQDMFTQSAFRFGPYVAHFGLTPTSAAQSALSSGPLPPSSAPDIQRALLRTYFAAHAATYALRAQFASSPTMHSVEDASVVWPEASAPWVELGTVEFPMQESFSAARLAWWERTIALSPWDGLAAHRPLGSVNRLRKRVYEMSRTKRDELNKEKSRFPQSIDEVPE